MLSTSSKGMTIKKINEFFVILGAMIVNNVSFEIKEDVFMFSTPNSNILSEGESLLLNCTGKISLISFDSNELLPTRVKLQIINENNRVVKESSISSLNNSAQLLWESISHIVKHEFDISTKSYFCQFKSDLQNYFRAIESKNIIFANTLQAPTNITVIFVQSKFYIFADTIHNKVSENALGISYFLRIRGQPCLNEEKSFWNFSYTCKIFNRNNANFVRCVVDLQDFYLCRGFDVFIITTNSYDNGKTQSQLFFVRRDDRQNLFSTIKISNVTASNITFNIFHNIEVSEFQDVIYKIKYRGKDVENNSTQILTSKNNMITITNLSPQTCYYFWWEVKAIIFNTNDTVNIEWSNPKEFCTSVDAGTTAGGNVSVFEIQLIISCIVPAVVISILLGNACYAYYNKKI